MATLRADARTTPSAVNDLLDSGLEDSELHAFINAASYVVDEIEEADSTVAADRLENIEAWLSAHFATTRPVLADSEQQESYRVDYLHETTYGQTAEQLDPTNTLSEDDGLYIEFGSPDAKGTR